MKDNGDPFWLKWSMKIADAFTKAMYVLGYIAGLALLVGIMRLAYVEYIESADERGQISENFDKNIADPIKKWRTDCDELREEIEVDRHCLRTPNCTLTRDELEAYDERTERYNKYCWDYIPEN